MRNTKKFARVTALIMALLAVVNCVPAFATGSVEQIIRYSSFYERYPEFQYLCGYPANGWGSYENSHYTMADLIKTAGCDEYVVTYCNEYISLREEANTSSPVISRICLHETVNAYGTWYDWTLVSYNQRMGWVLSRYLTFIDDFISYGGSGTSSAPGDMCFDSEERYRASYYMSNYGEQCVDGREFVMYDYYGTDEEQIAASLLTYAYINRGEMIYRSGSRYAISVSDFNELVNRHLSNRSLNIRRISSSRFRVNGNEIILESSLTDHVQNNYITIVYSAEYEYGSYRVGFRIYRASSSYWRNSGYWFDKSVYRMTAAEVERSGNFTRVASGVATLDPYKISSGYSYSLRSYHITEDLL